MATLKTLRQRANRATKRAWEAYNEYVTVRRSFRAGQATIEELAQALAKSDKADAWAAHAQAQYLHSRKD